MPIIALPVLDQNESGDGLAASFVVALVELRENVRMLHRHSASARGTQR